MLSVLTTAVQTKPQAEQPFHQAKGPWEKSPALSTCLGEPRASRSPRVGPGLQCPTSNPRGQGRDLQVLQPSVSLQMIKLSGRGQIPPERRESPAPLLLSEVPRALSVSSRWFFRLVGSLSRIGLSPL